MKISILTLFPEMFDGPFSESIIKRAQEKGLVEISIHDLRNWGIGKHKMVDDRPYGGGVGMVMMIEPVSSALKDLKTEELKNSKTILLTPQGKTFKQATAQELSKLENLILICGHYEGFDERIRDLVDEEISIGDYVLTGGEIPAMVITDAVARLIPGVLEKPDATEFESFTDPKTLEYPHYTRPEEFEDKKVPEILLSGNHKKIEEWRKEESKKRTEERRPDLK